MTLCHRHHSEIEAMISDKLIPRCGEPQWLAWRTLRLLRGFTDEPTCKKSRRKNQKRKQRTPKKKKRLARNFGQEFLLREQWFLDTLNGSRDEMLKKAREVFTTHKYKGSMISNCCALWRRSKYIPIPSSNPTKNPEPRQAYDFLLEKVVTIPSK